MNQAIGANNYVVADFNILENRYVTSDPGVLSDFDSSNLEFFELNIQFARFVEGVQVIVVINLYAFAEDGVVSDLYETQAVYRTIIIKEYILTNFKPGVFTCHYAAELEKQYILFNFQLTVFSHQYTFFSTHCQCCMNSRLDGCREIADCFSVGHPPKPIDYFDEQGSHSMISLMDEILAEHHSANIV
jgi:hypothetical protein